MFPLVLRGDDYTYLECLYHRKLLEMKAKFLGETKIDKFKNSLVSRSRMSLWMIRVMTILLIWSCFVHLVALGGMWGPRLLKGWPCWLSHHEFPMAAQEMASLPMKIALPPKSKHVFFLVTYTNVYTFVYSLFSLRDISEQWLSYGFLQWRTQPNASCGKHQN